VSIAIERTGLFDTLQDAGRQGFRSFGVPQGGWFDAESAMIANALVGNDLGAPCLEATSQSGLYRATRPLRVAIVGPGSMVTVRRSSGEVRSFPGSLAVTLLPGDRFEAIHHRSGFRTYVAVAGGGWRAKSVLGSVSSETRLLAGETIESAEPDAAYVDDVVRTSATGPDPDRSERPMLSFVASREFEERMRQGDDSAEFDTAFRMSGRSDRVGVRFAVSGGSGFARLFPADADRLSAPVVPGTIQWTGAELIVLGVAGGTMGGYPVCGHLLSSDLARLGQMRPGETVRLRPISVESARISAAERSRDMARTIERIRLCVRDRFACGGEFRRD
jgi:allophanate hydrolase subunit 2